MEVSNPDKLIFEEAGYTKQDLVDHYRRVAPTMIELVRARPLTLQRFPNGIGAPGFMQKNASRHFPESIERFEVDKREGGTTAYPVVHRAEDLVYLANQGTVTFHVWTSRLPEPDRPDWLVLDLDPTEGDLDGVRAVTRLARSVLERFGLAGTPVATGSKGFHVWCPIVPSRPTGEVGRAARAIAELIARADPEQATTEFRKRDRGRRVFVDWLRSNYGATVVAPLSLRPRPRATVAAPISWERLDAVDPDGFTIATLADADVRSVDGDPVELDVEAIVEAAEAEGIDVDAPFDRFGRN